MRMSDASCAPTRTTTEPVLFSKSVSLPAPVVTVTVDGPAVVGVPATAQVTVCPIGTTEPWTHGAATGLMVHPVTTIPAGRPLIEHVAPVASAVAEPLLPQLKLPVYGTPVFAVGGRPPTATLMSANGAAAMSVVDVAVLFAALASTLDVAIAVLMATLPTVAT